MDDTIMTNPLLDRLPKHLKQYIKPQYYETYTAIDQAVWRYVMRKNVNSLRKVAHPSYLKGLEQTGIAIDSIPNMYGMNRILQEIGWAAVAVDGFIPPGAFMEFQAYHVLVIASDIRQLEHIEYTAAPDIIHEGAGHAPIIANPEYSEYLRRFGALGCKAISNAKDHELYEAVRALSILKETATATNAEIKAAEQLVKQLQSQMGTPSEMAQIRNLHWWTVEYGLIGSLDAPKIYGAGLLSSIGESKVCLTASVKKIPYTIAASQQAFDITQPQPQLYVTPDFAQLSMVLEEFADTMGLRTGGYVGMQKLIASKVLGTAVLSTGIQVSGVFSRVITTDYGSVAYIQTNTPTVLAFSDTALIGHGTAAHAHGFGTAIGKLKGINLAIEDMSPRDLRAYAIHEGKQVCLEFEGGITVAGKIITGIRNLQGKIIVISFEECTVTYHEELLFKPEWGRYDMAVGATVVSAYAGAADVKSFDLITHKVTSTTSKPMVSSKRKELQGLYASLRNIRTGKHSKFSLEGIFELLQQYHPEDWLLPVELYELVFHQDAKNNASFLKAIQKHLEAIKKTHPHSHHLIDEGLELIHSKV